MKWQLRCLIGTAKALLPFQEELRHLKDLVVGYQRNPQQDTATIRDGLTMIDWLGDLSGRTILEVGSGWQPMVPMLLSSAGAERVYMTDLHRLMRKGTIAAAEQSIRDNWAEISVRLNRARDRLDEMRNLVYMAPCDCRNLPLRSESIDILVSRACLEHIPRGVIEGIFREAARILRPGGCMLHLIDYSDHWSHRDRSITDVNFLQYPDWLFRLTSIHPQNYQNRLRHPEFVEMMENAGSRVRKVQAEVNQSCRDALGAMRITARFQRFSIEDLAITGGILFTEKASSVEN